MARVVDLTHPLSAETPVHPKDTPVKVVFPLTHAKHGMALSSLVLSSHAGTHMDAPFHMLPEGKTLDHYDVSRFVGTAVVLDVRGRSGGLSRETVAAAADAAGGLRPGDFALIWAGWDEHFGGASMSAHPYVTGDSAAYLRECGVTLVGVDFPSIDSSAEGSGKGIDAFDLSAHKALMSADILIVENLRNLGEIAGRRAPCAILPLSVVGVEGAPVRAVAWVEE